MTTDRMKIPMFLWRAMIPNVECDMVVSPNFTRDFVEDETRGEFLVELYLQAIDQEIGTEIIVEFEGYKNADEDCRAFLAAFKFELEPTDREIKRDDNGYDYEVWNRAELHVETIFPLARNVLDPDHHRYRVMLSRNQDSNLGAFRIPQDDFDKAGEVAANIIDFIAEKSKKDGSNDINK